MKYEPGDPVLLKAEQEENNAGEEDEETDIKPRHCKAKRSLQIQPFSNGDEADENDTDEDGKDDDDKLEWNIRKCSAAAIDVLASVFEGGILQFVLPELQNLLNSSDWLELESGILVLGAIAEGCGEDKEFQGYLQGLIQQMISAGLSHERALVRGITCWTLSRYSSWVVKQLSSGYSEYDDGTWSDQQYYETKDNLFKPFVLAILKHVMDPSKRVQEAACSAFATIEEEACHELEDYLPDILETMIHAVDLYQTVNLMILYDAIGTLADVIGDPLHNVRGIEQLILKLIQKWDETPTDYKDPKSKNVFALLECLATLFMSIGKHYMNHSRTVFEKSAVIIKRHLDYSAAYEQQQQALAKSFTISA